MPVAGTTTDDESNDERYHIAKTPKTDKEMAIIDAAIENPTGTNQEIADRAVELDEDLTQIDPSWVSRVRNEFLEIVEDDTVETTDTPSIDEDNVEDIVRRVERLEDELDTIIDSVMKLHESVDRLERQEREEEITRLESRLDELRGDAAV